MWGHGCTENGQNSKILIYCIHLNGVTKYTKTKTHELQKRCRYAKFL